MGKFSTDGVIDDDGEVPKADQVSFEIDEPAFVDFGCGSGGSMKFAQSLARARGVGIDLSADRVAACSNAGYDVQVADAVRFEARGAAPMALAIDLMPELSGLADFELVCRNLLRTARDFVLIQHLCFDSAESLLARGLFAPEHAHRSIRFRPRVLDYVHFTQRHARSLNIVGLAAFGIGQSKTEALPMQGLAGTMAEPGDEEPAYRSVRILMARKSHKRFQSAMSRAGNGTPLLIWEAPSDHN